MYLIAGIDPGTTTGLALLDLRGNLLDLFSSKDFGLTQTIGYLISRGTVSLIATDVASCPGSVSKIATKLGAPTYSPPTSLLIREKIDLTRKYNPKNAHQRDALAAALVAFHNFQPKFQKINAFDFTRENKEKIKHLLLQGLSIKKAQLKLEQPLPGKKVITITKTKIIPRKGKKNHQEERLKTQISEMGVQLSQKERKIEKLKRDILVVKETYQVSLKKEEEIQKRERSIQTLKDKITQQESELKKLGQLKELWSKIANRETIPLVVFPRRGKNILILRKLKRKDLNNLPGVKIAFTSQEANKKHLREKGILLGDVSKVHQLLGVFYVSSRDLKQIEEENNVVSLEEIVTNYREEKSK